MDADATISPVMSASIYTALRLAPAFDASRLYAEIASLSDSDWIPHFNAGYHDGGWFGFPLRAVAGGNNPLYPDPVQREFVDQPVLAQWRAVREALAAFRCPLRSVRLLKLRAGGVIREHRDDGLGFEHGEVRLHVPIVSNPEMSFYVDGVRLPMEPGETWYVNVNLPHRVRNAGATDRIHLVIDCLVNDWIAALFAAGQSFARSALPVIAPGFEHTPLQQHLNEFQWRVWNDPALQAKLFDTEDADLFVREVVASALEQGYALSAEAVVAALRKSRETWTRRNTIR